jgi:hypothetical protein
MLALTETSCPKTRLAAVSTSFSASEARVIFLAASLPWPAFQSLPAFAKVSMALETFSFADSVSPICVLLLLLVAV